MLWRSLPAYSRRELLINMYKTKIGKTGCREGDLDAMAYRFLGHSVRKTACLMLTGIGSWSLSKARGAALKGKMSIVSLSELSRAL